MRRDVLALGAVALVATGCAHQAPSWARVATVRYPTTSTLPAPATQSGMPLDEALARRRSVRSFAADALPMATIGQLLWAGQGVTSADGKRTAPSAGALYPLELYVATADSVMHYLPAAHSVEIRSGQDARPQLQRAAFDQGVVAQAPAVVVIAAVYARATGKYGSRGRDYVEREAGHAAQNILLEATALGLGAVPVGGLEPAGAAVALALPPDETVLYLIPVGRPR